jgi:Sporulation and spore germination
VSRHRCGRVVAVGLGLAVLTACGIDTDTEPRPVDPGVIEPDPRALDPSGGSDGFSTVFMVSPDGADGDPALQPVGRTSDRTPLALLTALFGGPTVDEVAGRVRTDIPLGLALRSVTVRNGTITIDVGPGLEELAGESLIRALAQITLTATTIEGIRAAQITVEGVVQQWPAGSGELQSDPLTSYDFPGLVPSQQPPYPAIPSRPLEVPTTSAANGAA